MTIETLLREALKEVDYLEITTEEQRQGLRKLACELSNRIKKQFGEVPIWFASNRIIRAIDDAKLSPILIKGRSK